MQRRLICHECGKAIPAEYVMWTKDGKGNMVPVHLVKKRDEELAETYQSIIGEWPPSRGEVHHAKHAGSGGPDKEDNLIHLSYETHRFKVHGLSGTRKQYMDEQIKTYLNCHAVKEWRKEHEMELQELYKTEEERRIKKKRAGCIPKKPKWAKY